VKHLQEDIDEKELKEMIQEFDRDQSGVISREQFLTIMQTSD
jgi:Ca2+-binding EF-hand superfamily protein